MYLLHGDRRRPIKDATIRTGMLTMNDVPTLPTFPPRIGDVAPDFAARSTAGAVRLSAYRGQWVLFFSHPADFTPVCTSEIMAFARSADAFAALDCALLGLSVDSLPAHMAWLKDIKARFGVTVGFPLIEDASMVIARAYGMIDATSATSATVRAVWVIDPAGILRATVSYPVNIGRSVAELLRLVAALKAADARAASTPEGWQPGMSLLAMDDAMTGEDAALAEDEAWYFRKVQP